MKRSDELKIKKGEHIARMQAIKDLATGESARALTDAENTEFNNLKTQVEELNRSIADAEFLEANTAPAPAPGAVVPFQIKRNADTTHSVGKAISEFVRGGANALTGIEAETHQELARNIETGGLLIPTHSRTITPNDTTTNAAQIDVKIDPGLSIIGYEPLWNKMGLTVLPNLQGTFKLGKMTHHVAQKVGINTELSTESNIPTFVTMTPDRFGITDIFGKELLATTNPAVQNAIVSDMIKGADRAITAEAYAVALAAASEVAAGAITVAGFNAMMAALDNDGAFAMARASFFAAKAVPIDSGSGRFLTSMTGETGVGLTYDGVKAFYSNLFADGANKQYVIYGNWAEIWAGFWGALEILVNPYTYQKSGQVELTVNRLANLVCRNSAAFKKSPDLDSAT